MKKQLLFFCTIILICKFLYSASQVSPNTFLFCLKSEIQPFEISLNRGNPSVGVSELDDFFQLHKVINIEPWIKSARDIDRDGNIFLNRIYRVYLDDSKVLSRDQIIKTIQSFPFILYAEPEYIRKPYYTPNDPKYYNQCSMQAVKADLAWEYWDIPNEMPGDKNILLASVDTGVDYTHPDLIENIWVNQGEITWAIEAPEVNIDEDDYVSAIEINNFMASQGDLNNDGEVNLRDIFTNNSPFLDGIDNDGNGFIDDLIGWDCSGFSGQSDNDPFPMVNSGILNDGGWAHGTHVAGILAATTDNEIGIASTVFNGKILSVKAARENGEDINDPSIHDGYDGITYAAKVGFYAGLRTIINNSWGGSNSSSSEQAVINNAYNTYGAIIVSAAGNGDGDAEPDQEEYASHYPASYENVVSVCAVNCAGYWGNWATYHTTVDLAAPGDNIYSTILDNEYVYFDGSSMASPNAASVMGLVWSFYPEWSNEDIINMTLLSADSSIYDINPAYIDCNGKEGEYCLGAGMVDAQKAIGMGFSPNIHPSIYNFVEIIGDGDGIINPGEAGYLTILLKNKPGWADAENISVILSTENLDITIIEGISNYGNISSGDSLNNLNDKFEIEFSDGIDFGTVIFQLQIMASNSDYNYSQTIEYTNITVSINQAGFPVSTAELRSSPLVIDLDGDGNQEIIIGDNNGFVHIYNSDGSEVQNATFPFDTGNQIWGSAAAADLDRDGYTDFVITSKSKHLYIFDQNGLKTDYNANKYLMGTPAIGNLDDDDDLEVVIGGYSSPSSSSPIFAINPDGSDVDGFPLILGEKTKAGPALADYNGNGKDDIIIGTDDNNIYLIYDDGTTAPGFPYTTGDKMQAAPTVIDVDGEKIIFAGSNDNNLYAVNSNGSLRFSIQTGDKVQSSPSFLDYNGGQYIFFGSNDDMIYAVDIDGNTLNGWPLEVNGTIGGSVVFSDLNNDNNPEVVAATETGDILALHLDGSYVTYFPIANDFPSSGSPMVIDLDGDNDLEIMAGSGSNLFVVDIKDSGNTDNYWNIYRGGVERNGYRFYLSDDIECSVDLGDVSGDGNINILDLVQISNYILNISTPAYSCAADFTGDGNVNILDLVQIANFILDN